jgi:murein DD-endopeptidase MepM/ murein hydrolase activator NlpD
MFTMLIVALLGSAAQATTKRFDIAPFFGQPLAPAAHSVALQPQATVSPRVKVFVSVRTGDTLATLGQRYGLSVRQIKLENGMTKDALQPGVTLKIPLELNKLKSGARASRLPPGASWHTVRPRETLSEIHREYGVTQADLVNANPGLRSLDQIRPGERLIVPGDVRGAYIKLKSGDTLLSVAANYDLELMELMSANDVWQLNALQAGDYVLLPGISADATAKRLEQRRAAEALVRVQMRYELARINKARARMALTAQAATRSAAARANLRTAQRSQTTLVRRASANYSFPSYGGGYIWPMRGVITSGYGRRGFWIGSSNFHTGVDIASGYGSPIYAAHSGYVTQAGYGYFGLNVWINVGGGIENIYGHLSRAAVYAGSYVQRGQLIGYEGCSGVCTGPHLHFEVRIGGRHVNPLRYLP